MKKNYLIIAGVIVAGVIVFLLYNKKKKPIQKDNIEETIPESKKVNGVSKEMIVASVTANKDFRAGFLPSEILALIDIESSFDIEARPFPTSEHVGLGQMNKASLSDALKTKGEKNDSANVDRVWEKYLTDYETQIIYLSAYLRWCISLRSSGGNLDNALAVYSGTNQKTKAERDKYISDYRKAQVQYTQYDYK